MTQTYPMIKNYRITISEDNGEIEFLRKVVKGGASKSYGIQVAKMAGLPHQVVSRAKDLMNRMQKDNASNLSTRKKDVPTAEVPQLNLFNYYKNRQICLLKLPVCIFVRIQQDILYCG